MRLLVGALTILLEAGALSSTYAQQSPTLSPRDQLQQYVTQLQANPSDDALRTKIIQLALTLDPPPAVPPEATEHEGAAEYAFKHVESPADFQSAATEYEKALLIAPWAAGDYYNLAVCYDKAGNPQKAIAAYQLYLLAAPDAKDANYVTKHIGALKYVLEQQQEQSKQVETQRGLQESARREQQTRDAAAQMQWGGVWRQTGGTTKNYWDPLERARHDTYHDRHVIFQIQGDRITEAICYDMSDTPHYIAEGDTSFMAGTLSGDTASLTNGRFQSWLQLTAGGQIEVRDIAHPREVAFTYSRVNDPGAISPRCAQ